VCGRGVGYPEPPAIAGAIIDKLGGHSRSVGVRLWVMGWPLFWLTLGRRIAKINPL
jgi:hypothetical protein